MSESVTYVAGGTVQAGGGVYIARQADQELLELCRAGRFAYVLTPRQMGKSSLMVRTAETLRQENIRSVIVDLTKMGTQTTPDAWYLGLLTIICRELKLVPQLVKWWQEHQYLGATQRLTQFFEEVILTQVAERIVIFVDEIDTTLNLDFADDFFIAIRYFYLARAETPDFERLSFVLIGVATPSDLIQDPQRTPFNIGERVDLTDFTLTEALPLAAGLAPVSEVAQQTLRWVLDWTGGHPYLTQRLCSKLTEAGQKQWNKADVAAVVQRNFFGEASKQDTNLQFVRDMLTRRSPDLSAGLTIYRDVLKKRRVVDEEQSLIKSHLKLSGVVKRDNSLLRVRNPIYQTVFDLNWVQEHLPINWVKRLRRAAITAGTIFLAATFPLAVIAEMSRREAVKALSVAETEREQAEQQRELAEELATIANRQRIQLADALSDAQKARRDAEDARRDAEDKRIEAEAAQKRAEIAQSSEAQQRQKAEAAQAAEAQQRQRAEQQTAIAKAAEAAEAQQRQLAEQQTEIAVLREKSTQGLIRLSSPRAVEGLILAMYSVLKSKDLSEEITANSDVLSLNILSLVESNLLQASEGAKEQLVMQGHTGKVLSAALSPDRQRIVSGGEDTTVRLWDARGNLLKTLQGHENPVVSVSFTSNGRQIISVDRNGVVKRWGQDGTLIRSLESETNFNVASAIVGADGQTIAATLTDGSIAVQDEMSDRWREWLVKPPVVREVLGNLQEGDEQLETGTNFQERYPFEGRSGQGIFIRLESEEFSTGLLLEDANGNNITLVEDVTQYLGASGNDSLLWTVLPESGRYTVVATSADATNGAYQIQIDDVQLGEPLVSPEPAAQLEEGERTDAYQFEGRAGQEISIRMESEDFDTLLVLQNTDGETLAENDDRGDSSLNSTLTTVIPADGTYTILASSYQESGVGSYTLEVNELLSAPIVQDARAGLGQVTNYRYGDSYLVERQAGQKIAISMESQDFDAFLILHDEAGNVVAENDDRGDGTLNSEIITELPQNGTYKVIATSLGTSSGTYQLLVDAQPLNSISISPSGQQLVTAAKDGTLQIWDLQGNPLGAPFQGHQGEVLSVAFSADGQRIVSGGSDRTVRVWDLSGRPLGEPFREHGSAVLSVAFSSDGDRIISGGQDGTVRLSNLEGNSLGQPFRGHRDAVLSAAFSSDDQTIVSSSSDGTLRLWDNSINIPFIGHEDGVAWGGVAFSPDGQTIVSGSYDRTLRLWDLQGEVIQTFRGHEDSVRGLAFSPDGQFIASSSSDGTIRLWDLQGNLVQTFRGHEGATWGVAFSPDGQRIASGSDSDNTVRLWDLQGNLLRTFEHANGVSGVAFSPDGQSIASGSTDVLTLWDLQGNVIRKFQLPGNPINDVAFSPDGRFIVSGNSDRTVQLWDLQSTTHRTFLGHEAQVTDVAFSPDSQRIVSSSQDQTVRLWDTQGNPIGSPIRNSESEAYSEINAVAFSPDGQRVVSGNDNGTLLLWSVSSADRFVSACGRLRYHPALLNPGDDYDEDFRQVASEVRQACEPIWHQSISVSSWNPAVWLQHAMGMLVRPREN